MPDTTLVTRNAWDKRDDETEHSYGAFKIYLSLPRFGRKGEKRSLALTAKRLGHNALTTVEHWSSRFDWKARVNAYEMSLPSLPQVYEEQSVEDYRSTVITKSTQVISALWEILGHELENLRKAQLQDNLSVTVSDLQKLTRSAQAIQEMARQSAGLPRDYGIVDEMDDEDANATRAVVIMGELTDDEAEDAEVS